MASSDTVPPSDAGATAPASRTSTPSLATRCASEALGTFTLVFGGCGAAIFAAHVLSKDATPVNLGIGYAGVALAFGLTVLTMAYALAHVSGAHFNPAVTLGLAAARRFEWKNVLPYWLAQVVGGLIAGCVLYVIATSRPGFSIATDGFATNGYGSASPGGYGLAAVLLCEVVCTALFLYVILGVTDGRAPKGFGPLAIGLALTLIHLVSIPVSNTSVNPARSTAVAFFGGATSTAQLWAFWVAPLVGALIAGFTYRFITGEGAYQESTLSLTAPEQ